MKEIEVKELLNENNLKWDDFIDWMIGQTHGIVDGEPDYYEWDVKKFVRNHK